MIQRIQSVYLALAAVALVAMLFFSGFWSDPAIERLRWLNPVILIGALVVAVGAVGAVFLYKNRAQQRQVVLVLQLLTLALMAILYVGAFFLTTFSVLTAGSVDAAKVIVLLLPAVAYVCFMLARRGIQRDIALIRSQDRLR